MSLFSKDELFSNSTYSSILSNAAKKARENNPPINMRAIREQQDWNKVANQIVGAENENVPHKSIAVWPDAIKVGNIEGKNESVDTHNSKEAAEAVCNMLKKHGFGGEGKVFPISVRVEKII